MTHIEPLIRTLTLAEIETLIDWAGNEGWNPGLADADAFQAADPNGFIGCFVEGRMAAAIAAIAYGDDFGFIGLYICHPEFRGKGYGKRVWDAGMRHLSGRSVALDGVPAQQDNYRRSGFVSQYETVRWSGRLNPDTAAPDLSGIEPLLLPEMLEALSTFDRAFFPAPRLNFLERWTGAPRTTLVAYENGAIRGYGTLRQCREGYKIGPLFAESQEISERLFQALAASSGYHELHIDVPETNPAFAAFLEKAGFSRGFVTARMVSGVAPTRPALPPAGITTLELG